MKTIKYLLTLIFLLTIIHLFWSHRSSLESDRTRYIANIEQVKPGSNIFEAMELMDKGITIKQHKIEFSHGDFGTLDSACYLQIKYPDLYQQGIRWSDTEITFDGKTGEVLQTTSWFPF